MCFFDSAGLNDQLVCMNAWVKFCFTTLCIFNYSPVILCSIQAIVYVYTQKNNKNEQRFKMHTNNHTCAWYIHTHIQIHHTWHMHHHHALTPYQHYHISFHTFSVTDEEDVLLESHNQVSRLVEEAGGAEGVIQHDFRQQCSAFFPHFDGTIRAVKTWTRTRTRSECAACDFNDNNEEE